MKNFNFNNGQNNGQNNDHRDSKFESLKPSKIEKKIGPSDKEQ